MIWQRAMKYPMLIVGVILFTMFLFDGKTKEWWSKFSYRYIPNTCQTIKDRVQDKLADNWSVKCPQTELMLITIEEKIVPKKPTLLRSLLYKQLANHYSTFSQTANPETLEMLKKIKITLKHGQMQIVSQSSGKSVVQFRALKQKSAILRHLQKTVKVKEVQ